MGLDLLAEVLGRAADHEARDEDREHDEEEHAVEAGADAADDDFPDAMLASGTRPPIGVNESCQELMAPQEASVVIVAKRAESPIPNRTSLPSMLPPVPPAVGRAATPSFWWIGFPFCSAISATNAPTKNINAIAPKTAQPCFTDPVIRPRVFVSPAPTAKMRIISRKFVPGVGFS